MDDLPRVKALAFSNSLRGWVDARLHEEAWPIVLCTYQLSYLQ